MRRITSLGIIRDGDKSRFAKIQAMASEVITDDFCSRLPARSIAMVPTIRKNARVFGAALSGHLKSNGLGQQYGALLAGAWSLFSDSVVSADAAKKWVDDQYGAGAWIEQTAQQTETDHAQCLDKILQTIIRAQTKHGPIEQSIAKLMAVSSERKQDDVLTPTMAADILGLHGLRGDPDGMVISVSHSGVAAILKDSQWARNWGHILARIPGAHKTSGSVPFGETRSRGIEIEWEGVGPSAAD